MALIEEAHKASRLLLDHSYVRILARDEPDATCAAVLLAHALRRESVDFHVTWTPRLDEATLGRLAQERNDALVLVGLGADALPGDPEAARVVVLDRAESRLKAEALLDPRHATERGPRTHLAGLAQLVAVAMAKRNRDLAPLALAGALAEFDHAGGLKGLAAEILSEALEGDVVERRTQLALHGPTLLSALSQLDAPFVEGVTGRARNVKKLLGDLRLDPEEPPGRLAPEAAERLGSFLTLRLLQQGAPDAGLDVLFRPALRALQGPHTGLESGELARLAEAACATGRCGLAFTALWPDASATPEALEAQARVRQELVAALVGAERGARREGRLVVADAPRAPLCRPLAARLAVSLVPEGHVAVARHAAGDMVHLALRAAGPGAPALERAARHAADTQPLPVEATPGAVRALVPAAEETRFLKALAEALP